MTLLAEELVVDTRALSNLLRAARLLGWLRHGGNVGLNHWHRRLAAKLEGQQACWSAFRFQGRHVARFPEQTVSTSHPDRRKNVLLAIDDIRYRYRLHRGTSPNRPDLPSGVCGISSELAARVPMENQIPSGSQDAAVDLDRKGHHPARLLLNKVERDELAVSDGSILSILKPAAASATPEPRRFTPRPQPIGFKRGPSTTRTTSSGLVRRNIHKSSLGVVAHGKPPVPKPSSGKAWTTGILVARRCQSA